jgi:hypothetical protein
VSIVGLLKDSKSKPRAAVKANDYAVSILVQWSIDYPSTGIIRLFTVRRRPVSVDLTPHVACKDGQAIEV